MKRVSRASSLDSAFFCKPATSYNCYRGVGATVPEVFEAARHLFFSRSCVRVAFERPHLSRHRHHMGVRNTARTELGAK